MRRRFSDLTWSEARRLVEEGRVSIDESPASDPSLRLVPGQGIVVRERPIRKHEHRSLILFEDRHLVVAEKPSGMSSVPYERGERETLMDAVRAGWRRRGLPPAARVLHVVHRLDKETSGLLLFARTRASERALQAQFRKRQVSRGYLCLAHGSVADRTIESRLVANRGDGLRGSTSSRDEGKLAVTHIRVRKTFSRTTLCEARLETGRTHQIRIQLAESGHPVVGERVYIRDFVARGGAPIASPRLMLHAATLAFGHPIHGGRISLESRETPGFLALVDRFHQETM
ncbi:MAG: RluA family pseudouridine synthase [Vicinamibacteria bacterium]